MIGPMQEKKCHYFLNMAGDMREESGIWIFFLLNASQKDVQSNFKHNLVLLVVHLLALFNNSPLWHFNPIALRKANFGLSECSRVKQCLPTAFNFVSQRLEIFSDETSFKHSPFIFSGTVSIRC